MEGSKAAFDPWADWLLYGRQRGAPQAHVSNQATYLARVTDRVLTNGRIGIGDHVLDVGAGTGQLAIEELRRVGAKGRVVAVDLSLRALSECGRVAREDGAAGRQIELVQADAAALPFRDATFDVVTTRSVVAYVADRSRALQEMHRILRAGGRASLYEPITRFEVAPNIRTGDAALAPIAERHRQVIEHMWTESKFGARLDSFDEHDLTTDLLSAGFTAVDVVFEHHIDLAHEGSAWEAETFRRTEPHPGTISYEQAAYEVLGEAAELHLDRFEQLLGRHTFHFAWAVAFVSGRKLI